MKRIAICIGVTLGALCGLAASGLKTPETSSLFVPSTDPDSGVKSYVLRPGLTDWNQQSIYFTAKSMTDDGRFLLFYGSEAL